MRQRELLLPAQRMKLPATLYSADAPSSSSDEKPLVVYFHGGGFLCGQRNDLDESYIQKILDSGCELLALGYPLCPETGLLEVIEVLNQALCWMMSRGAVFEGRSLVLFGRSAGAYLACKLAHDLQQKGIKVAGVASFYGFSSFSKQWGHDVTEHYRELRPVSIARVYPTQDEPLFDLPVRKRYLLYVHARQTQSWFKLMSISLDDIPALSLTDADLAALPRMFVAASDGDRDVPFAASLNLVEKVPQVAWYPVQDLEHDFDRDPHREESQEAYRRLSAWLSEL